MHLISSLMTLTVYLYEGLESVVLVSGFNIRLVGSYLPCLIIPHYSHVTLPPKFLKESSGKPVTVYLTREMPL